MKRQQEEELMRACPFAPTTGRPPTHPRHGALGALPVGERLHAIAQARQQRRARQYKEGAVAMQLDDEEAAECTFAPKINKEANERQLDACSWRCAVCCGWGEAGSKGGEHLTLSPVQLVIMLLQRA